MSRDAGRALEPEGIAKVTPCNRLALGLCPACSGGIHRLGVADDAFVGLAKGFAWATRESRVCVDYHKLWDNDMFIFLPLLRLHQNTSI